MKLDLGNTFTKETTLKFFNLKTDLNRKKNALIRLEL